MVSNLTPSAVEQGPRQRSLDLDFTARNVAEMFKDLHDTFTISSINALVAFWLAKGVSLALAEPFVKPCLDSIDRLRTEVVVRGGNWHLDLSKQLLQNSHRPLVSHDMTTISDFARHCCGHELRPETLGIYLAAVGRASIEVPFFHPLYTTEMVRNQLRANVMRLADRILNLCMALDRLNDLQLVFQYENWILHSYADGDQSELKLSTRRFVVLSIGLIRSALLERSRRRYCFCVCSWISRKFADQTRCPCLSHRF